MSDVTMNRGILCPVDLSEDPAAVAGWAVTLAQACQSKLVAAYASATDVPAYITQGTAERLEAELDQSRDEARSRLAALFAVVPGIDVRVADGDPVTIIRELADSLQPSMIVMGTHGRTGIARVLEGSVAETVVHESRVPVLTVHSSDGLAAGQPIVCAANDSPASRKALQWAAHLANCLDRKLIVLHIAESGDPRGISDLCSWISEQPLAQCEKKEISGEGVAPEEILRLTGELGAGLLVFGAEHRRFRDRASIGSTAEKILRTSPCATLTVY